MELEDIEREKFNRLLAKRQIRHPPSINCAIWYFKAMFYCQSLMLSAAIFNDIIVQTSTGYIVQMLLTGYIKHKQ